MAAGRAAARARLSGAQRRRCRYRPPPPAPGHSCYRCLCRRHTARSRPAPPSLPSGAPPPRLWERPHGAPRAPTAPACRTAPRPPRPAPRPHPGRLRSDTGPRSGFCPGGVRLLPARVTARPDAAANLEIFFSHLFPAFFLCSFCPLCLFFLFFIFFSLLSASFSSFSHLSLTYFPAPTFFFLLPPHPRSAANSAGRSPSHGRPVLEGSLLPLALCSLLLFLSE